MSIISRLFRLWRKKPESPVFDRDTRLIDIPEFVPDGFRYGIEILNDDTTPIEFVVDVLQMYLGLSENQAIDTTLKIHLKGGTILPCDSLETAKLAFRNIVKESSDKGYDLICRTAIAQQGS